MWSDVAEEKAVSAESKQDYAMEHK